MINFSILKKSVNREDLINYTWELDQTPIVDGPQFNQIFWYVPLQSEIDSGWFPEPCYVAIGTYGAPTRQYSGLWTSTDLETWTPWEHNPWFETGNPDSVVIGIIKDGANYVVCHFGPSGSGGEKAAFMSGTSLTDLYNKSRLFDDIWTLFPNQSPMPLGSMSIFPYSFQKVGSYYYVSFDVGYTGDMRLYDSLLYRSTDLTTWEYVQRFIPKGNNGQWDYASISQEHPFYEPLTQSWYSNYMGYDTSLISNIGIGLVKGNTQFELNQKLSENPIFTNALYTGPLTIRRWKTGPIIWNPFRNEYEQYVCILFTINNDYTMFKLRRSGVIAGQTFDVLPSEKPIQNKAVRVSSTESTVSCVQVVGNNGYRWRISTDRQNWTYTTTAQNINSHSFTGLVDGTEYFVNVQTLGNGTTWTDSEWSNTVLVLTTAPDTNWGTEYQTVYNAFTNKPSTEDGFIQNRFVKHLVDNGLWSIIDYLQVSAIHGNDVPADYFRDWKTPSTRAAAWFYQTSGNRYAGIFVPYGGVTPSEYDTVRSNFNPSTMGVNYTLQNASFGFYTRIDVPTSQQSQMGCYDASSNRILITPRGHTGTNINEATFCINNVSVVTDVQSLDIRGMHFVDRLNSTVEYQVNTEVKSTATRTATAIPNAEAANIGIRSDTGTMGAGALSPYSMVFYAAHMTQAQRNLFFDGFEKYLAYYGKGVIY